MDNQLSHDEKAEPPVPKEWLEVLDSLETENDEPISIFADKQQRLLTGSLYQSWPELGRPFLTLANVGLFYSPQKPPLVPNVQVSLDVKRPNDVWTTFNRAYFIWKYGKPPEVAIEVVVDKEDKSYETQLLEYAQAGVHYYVIFDPLEQLKQARLNVYELKGPTYVEKTDWWLNELQLGLTIWRGQFEDIHETWLRWCDKEGNLILTSPETIQKIRQEKENIFELVE